MPEILPTSQYNKFMLDHDANCHAEWIGLKAAHVPNLIKILCAHGLKDVLEVHVLHRHFELQEGEVMIHKEISFNTEPGIKIDIAKAASVPDNHATAIVPVMWYFPQFGFMRPYEYAVGSDEKIAVPVDNFAAFIEEFSTYLWNNNLPQIVSLKDKSCVTGIEYVAYESRALFKIPPSIVNLPATGTLLIETGWDNSSSTPLTMTDTHKTITKKTTGGRVAVKHVTVTSDGMHAIKPEEISPRYAERMWAEVEGPLANWCTVGSN